MVHLVHVCNLDIVHECRFTVWAALLMHKVHPAAERTARAKKTTVFRNILLIPTLYYFKIFTATFCAKTNAKNNI